MKLITVNILTGNVCMDPFLFSHLYLCSYEYI